MKALTVHQPWAWLIVNGYKTIENRSRRTSHRGPLVIHAGLTVPDRFSMRQAGEVLRTFFGDQVTLPALDELPLGCLVGTSFVEAVYSPESRFLSRLRHRDMVWWETAMFGWHLSGGQEFPEPVTWRGMPGLFEVPDAVIAEALGQGQAQPVQPGGVV